MNPPDLEHMYVARTSISSEGTSRPEIDDTAEVEGDESAGTTKAPLAWHNLCSYAISLMPKIRHTHLNNLTTHNTFTVMEILVRPQHPQQKTTKSPSVHSPFSRWTINS